MIIITCRHCGKESEKRACDIARAKAANLRLYCDRKCSGLGRRKNRTKAENAEIKRLYDIEYRDKNIEMLTEKKRVYFQGTYNPEKAAIERARLKKERPHIEEKRREYMASKKYTGAKKKYDRRFRAYKTYGKEWGECMALTLDIRDECLSRMSDYEIRKANGTLGKSQQRRKDYERLNSNKSENCPLGNA